MILYQFVPFLQKFFAETDLVGMGIVESFILIRQKVKPLPAVLSYLC